jgi:hypothetical protein
MEKLPKNYTSHCQMKNATGQIRERYRKIGSTQFDKKNQSML